MILLYAFSLGHIIIISTVWIILTLVYFNRGVFKSLRRNAVEKKPSESIIHSGRFMVNVVYDSQRELNIDSLYDLTISYEKLAGGGYKIVEAKQQEEMIVNENSIPEAQTKSKISNTQVQVEDLTRYIDIKTIKN